MFKCFHLPQSGVLFNHLPRAARSAVRLPPTAGAGGSDGFPQPCPIRTPSLPQPHGAGPLQGGEDLTPAAPSAFRRGGERAALFGKGVAPPQEFPHRQHLARLARMGKLGWGRRLLPGDFSLSHATQSNSRGVYGVCRAS